MLRSTGVSTRPARGAGHRDMAERITTSILVVVFAVAFAGGASGQSRRQSDPPAVVHAIERIEQRGGWVARDKDGTIVEASLERTWATDNDIDFVVDLKTIRKLD